MRAVIVGQAPGARHHVDDAPLGGAVGRRLADLAGLDVEEFSALFTLGNVLPFFPGKAGKGDAFDLARARVNAEASMPLLAEHDYVLLLGRNVALAYGSIAADLPYLEWRSVFSFDPESRETRHLRVAVMPHPSGIVRWWNEPENVERARRFMRALAEEVK